MNDHRHSFNNYRNNNNVSHTKKSNYDLTSSRKPGTFDNSSSFLNPDLNNSGNVINMKIENNAFSTFSADELDAEFIEQKQIENDRQNKAIKDLSANKSSHKRNFSDNMNYNVGNSVPKHNYNNKHTHSEVDDNYQFTPLDDYFPRYNQLTSNHDEVINKYLNMHKTSHRTYCNSNSKNNLENQIVKDDDLRRRMLMKEDLSMSHNSIEKKTDPKKKLRKKDNDYAEMKFKKKSNNRIQSSSKDVLISPINQKLNETNTTPQDNSFMNMMKYIPESEKAPSNNTSYRKNNYSDSYMHEFNEYESNSLMGKFNHKTTKKDSKRDFARTSNTSDQFYYKQNNNMSPDKFKTYFKGSNPQNDLANLSDISNPSSLKSKRY